MISGGCIGCKCELPELTAPAMERPNHKLLAVTGQNPENAVAVLSPIEYRRIKSDRLLGHGQRLFQVSDDVLRVLHSH